MSKSLQSTILLEIIERMIYYIYFTKQNKVERQLCFHQFSIKLSDFGQRLVFLLTSKTAELLISVLEDLQLYQLSRGLTPPAVLQLEDKRQLIVGSQCVVEVLSIQKLHTVSPELKIKRPLLRESTFRIINKYNITLPVRLLFHQEKWHSLSYRILSFLENEGSPISSLCLARQPSTGQSVTAL